MCVKCLPTPLVNRIKRSNTIYIVDLFPFSMTAASWAQTYLAASLQKNKSSTGLCSQKDKKGKAASEMWANLLGKEAFGANTEVMLPSKRAICVTPKTDGPQPKKVI